MDAEGYIDVYGMTITQIPLGFIRYCTFKVKLGFRKEHGLDITSQESPCDLAKVTTFSE